jgi:AP2-associated kinase
MAQQIPAFPNNQGTLVPGQSISVNAYTVKVERYLNQGAQSSPITNVYELQVTHICMVGGFAHVYLVRTAVPVHNTTHHVLKRIAVANDAMLTDVKKEVDIMVSIYTFGVGCCIISPTIANTERPS